MPSPASSYWSDWLLLPFFFGFYLPFAAAAAHRGWTMTQLSLQHSLLLVFIVPFSMTMTTNLAAPIDPHLVHPTWK